MGRGRQGSGVRAHGDKIEVRFTFNGKRRHETLDLMPTTPNLKAAARMMKDVRDQIRLGVFDYAKTFPKSKAPEARPPEPKPVLTVKAYAETWLKTLLGEKSTLLSYRAQMRKFWLPKIGAKDITEVRHTDIATAIAEKAQAGASGKTTNNILIPIRAMFAAAVADGEVGVSPISNVHNRKHQRKEIDPFTPEEMELILGHMARYPETIGNYFKFAFSTGMRTSELIAILWGDIDWNTRTALVCRARVRHEAKVTKTHTTRYVDINPRAWAALVGQKAHSFMRGSNEPIFSDADGSPWQSERKLREDWFQPCLKALGIRQRPAYNTRHTYATINLMGGVNPAYIARQLGHANTAMLFKHYAKWIDGADKGAEAKKSGALFGANMGHLKTDAN